jgi:hypothetical protein
VTDPNEPGEPEVERSLRRFRPVGPPAGLRGRVLTDGRIQPARVWPWVAGAAAALGIVIAGHVLGGRQLARLDRALRTPTDRRVADDLAERLGGDDAARQAARWMLVEQDWRREQKEDMP